MTPFQQALQQVKEGKLKTPHVSTGGKEVDFFTYQFATHKFNLGLMAKGMCFKGITFTDIKKYYGLKGRGAKDCLEQFEKIMNDYKAELVQA